MSSAVTRAGQKWKEFWGSQITKNPQLEERKAEVNELNNYFQMADRTVSAISQCHSQLQVLYNQCAMIVTKVYEHETGSNKVIATNLVKMFQKVSEFNGEKVTPVYALKTELKPWYDTIDQLKILLERYQDDRLVYDHYKIKLDELKNSKDSAKITRNERKFEKATNTYQNLCIDIIGRIDRIISNKFEMVNSVLSKLILIEADIAMTGYKQLSTCLNFDKQFTMFEQNAPIQQEEIGKEDNFINKTRKLLSLPTDSKKSSNALPQQQDQRQIQFGETPTPNSDPDPFEEFNKAQAQFAGGFSDAESPALFKNTKSQTTSQQQQVSQEQLKQQFQQQQQKQYQNMKKERKQEGPRIDSPSQLPEQVSQQSKQQEYSQQQQFQQQPKPYIHNNQEKFTESAVYPQNPFFQNQPSQQNDPQHYQSVIVQPTQNWNPFGNVESNNSQSFTKVAKNPFDEVVDTDYVQQQNIQAQSQSQILSSRQTNPFMDNNENEQQPNPRMFQTYQPQINSNPFAEYAQQQPQQQNASKNPFI